MEKEKFKVKFKFADSFRATSNLNLIKFKDATQFSHLF